MNVFHYILLILFGFIHLHQFDAYKILGIFPTRCKSHWTIGHSVMKTLANAGYEVYVVSPFPLKTPINNYTDIFLDYGKDAIKVNMFDSVDWSPFMMVHFLSFFGEFMSNFILSHPNLQDIMQKKMQFDAVIIEIFGVEALYGLGVHLNCPVIGMSTFGTSKWTNDLTKNTMEYSYVPHNFLKYSGKMNFAERTINMIVSQYERIVVENVNYRKQIEIGGIHVDPIANSLPNDIQSFLDSADEGAIVFSMGSILEAVQLPVDKREAFVRSFGKLRQKVLWKYENDTLPNKPDNVMISKWIPQRDILSHPNVKLFITHGGLLGMTEAIYEGIPTLGIPIYADQKMNMNRAETLGIGIAMNYNEIDEHLILKNIKSILKNCDYHKNAEAISKVYKDRPMAPQSSVTYWVEYVIRYSGAKQLRSGAHDLNFIQFNSIDSYAVIISVLVICLYSIKRIINGLCMVCKTAGVKVKNS